MMTIVGVVIAAGGEEITTPVDATTTTVAEVVMADMAATEAVVETTTEVMIGTGDMMDATMLGLVIITSTTRADMPTTVGKDGEEIEAMTMEGGEMSRGEGGGADPENVGKEGDGAVRVLLGLEAEATNATPNAGTVAVGATNRKGADRGAKAAAAVEVWIVSIVQFDLPRISRPRAMATAVQLRDHGLRPDRIRPMPISIEAKVGAGAGPCQVAMKVEADKRHDLHERKHISLSNDQSVRLKTKITNEGIYIYWPML